MRRLVQVLHLRQSCECRGVSQAQACLEPGKYLQEKRQAVMAMISGFDLVFWGTVFVGLLGMALLLMVASGLSE